MGSLSLDSAEWIETIYKSHEEKKKTNKVISSTSSAATKAGDNYTSLMLRTKICSVLGSGEAISKNIIVKKKLESNESAASLNKAFLREAKMYKNILDKYSEMMRGTPLARERMWPTCFFGSSDALVMEDLKVLGYTLADRKAGLDLQHCLLVLKSLGRLHGMSVIAKDQNLINSNLLGMFGFLDNTAKDFFLTTLTALSNSIRKYWGSEWLYLSEKMLVFRDNMIERFMELYESESPLKVICHGDCWVNNQMFKYDHDGNPTNVMFVDFQMSHNSSFAWDVNYLIGTSIRHDIREPNYELFLQTYRDSMNETFRVLGSNRDAPSLEVIREECHRLRLFTFVVDALTVPIITCDSTEVVDIDAFFCDPSKAEHFYTKPEYVERMKIYFKKCIDDGTF